MTPEVIAFGEPMLEFNAVEPGSLREVHGYHAGYGGDTSNFAIAASRMGSQVGYLCRLGDDDFGRNFLDLWQSEGIDTRHVVLEKGSVTGIYFVARTGSSHSFLYYRQDSAASHFSSRDIPEQYLRSARVFHSSGISQAISNSACDAVFHAIDVARQAGVLVSYDPNLRPRLWGVRRARAIILETIGLSDFVFPSLEDAQLLTGLEDPEAIADLLLARGPQMVALKLGSGGVLLATPQGRRVFPVQPVEVTDTTGAGDTFAGAFVSCYLQGKSLEECAQWANAAASLTTTGWGAVNPIPGLGAVKKLLDLDLKTV
ncbi:MAG: sugar kinase [Anaerolineaceae bacterium]|nr:sugar kinase [Anaerolineaceae bacterium]